MQAADGDEERARTMILTDAEFPIREEDTESMRAAEDLRPCPFTSVFMCAACAAGERSPARILSSRFAKLARDLDPTLFAALDEVRMSVS